MADLITVTVERQAAQRLVKLAKREAVQTSARPIRDRMQTFVRDMERILSQKPPCGRCHGTHLVPNEAWDRFTLDADEEHEEAARHLFAAVHGPELQPCPSCRPAPVAKEAA